MPQNIKNLTKNIWITIIMIYNIQNHNIHKIMTKIDLFTFILLILGSFILKVSKSSLCNYINTSIIPATLNSNNFATDLLDYPVFLCLL